MRQLKVRNPREKLHYSRILLCVQVTDASYVIIKLKVMSIYDAVVATRYTMKNASRDNQREFINCLLESENLTGDVMIASVV